MNHSQDGWLLKMISRTDPVIPKDITAVVNVIAGKITDEAIMSAADVNGDGVVNVADIIKIANEIIGK